MQRDTIEQRAEQRHDEDQRRKAGQGAKSRPAPATNHGDGEHDRQGFDRLDQGMWYMRRRLASGSERKQRNS